MMVNIISEQVDKFRSSEFDHLPYDLGYVLMDLRYHLEKIESSGRSKLFIDLEQILGGHDSSIYDLSPQFGNDENMADFVFVEADIWARDERGQRFTGFNEAWNSNEQSNLVVFEYETKEFAEQL